MLCRSKVVLTIGGGVSIKLLWIEALKFSFFEIICLDKLFWFEYDIRSKESIWPCHLYKCDKKHIPCFPELKNLYINTFSVKGLYNPIFIYNVSNSTLKYSFMQAFPLDLIQSDFICFSTTDLGRTQLTPKNIPHSYTL